MIRGVLTLSTVLGAVTFAPGAAKLPVAGTYGNDAGCKLAQTGNYGEDDSARIMTPDSLRTMVTYCSFDRVEAISPNRHQVTMTCASEGEGPEANTDEKAEITGDPVSGFNAVFLDGTSWGPLKKCN